MPLWGKHHLSTSLSNCYEHVTGIRCVVSALDLRFVVFRVFESVMIRTS